MYLFIQLWQYIFRVSHQYTWLTRYKKGIKLSTPKHKPNSVIVIITEMRLYKNI